MGIIIMGGTGTGKSTVGNIISLRTSYKLYEIGHIVKGLYLKKMKQEANSVYRDAEKVLESVEKTFKVNSKDFFTNQRLKYVSNMVKEHGNDYFVKKLIEMSKNENIIVIGARSFEEIRAIEQKMQYPFFVGLTCNESKLVKRFVAREYNFMQPDKAEKIFEKRRWTENMWGVEKVMHKCNLVLSTEDKMPSDLATMILDEYRKFMKEKDLLKGGILYAYKKIIY